MALASKRGHSQIGPPRPVEIKAQFAGGCDFRFA
jgi:hypothetical protein